MTTNPSPPKPKFKVQWDLILWMIASFATLYLSEFASNLLFNEEVKRYVLKLPTSNISTPTLYCERHYRLYNAFVYAKNLYTQVVAGTQCIVFGHGCVQHSTCIQKTLKPLPKQLEHCCPYTCHSCHSNWTRR